MRWTSHRVPLALLSFLLAAPAGAQVPAGGEFRVNSVTTAPQVDSSVAVAANGDFVVVWQGIVLPDLGRIRGRRFSAAGVPIGAEFEVNTQTAYVHDSPAVASAAKGRFVVAWRLRSTIPPLHQVWAQPFHATGVAQGQNLLVDGSGNQPAVASDAAGNFTVAWESGQIYGRRFGSAGTPLGARFQVNAYSPSSALYPSVSARAGGEFVVAWQAMVPALPGFNVFARRFDAAGAPLGAELRVNTYTTLLQSRPAVTVAADGHFVATWDVAEDGSGFGILGRRVSAAGLPLGDEFTANVYTTGTQIKPFIASDEAGNFVVVWSSFAQDGSVYGVFGRRFTASGLPRGAEFRVNTYTSATQFADAVASDGAGNFVVTWGSTQAGNNDVMAQRFGGLLPAALAVDTAGNRVLEPGETVDVRPAWRNVNGAAQTFAGTAAGFSGPQPATYDLLDGVADYGTVPNGVTAQCTDCYRVAVPTTTRPAVHWDAVLEEKVTPDAQGQDKLWRLHLGGSFTDVPATSAFYRFVETLLHHGVTAGCGAAQFCPGDATTRAQLAPFVLVAKEGAGYVPPACTTPVFDDVPASSPFCRWIEELVRRGVVTGCSGNPPLYCPDAPVTRDQLPVFVLRTLDPTFTPPPCTTPPFNDVPPSSPFCPWIQELARRGVITGCGGGNYCPDAPVTREQMSVFLAVTFGLALYGP